MFNKYYQDELSFLRELGAEFAREHPKIANLLSDRSADPDVERLTEGFAFIAGQLRQKIDDELPELTHTLIGMLWPHYLRPVPSMTVLQFAPKTDVQSVQSIPRGTSVHSRPVDGQVCKFRTCYDVELTPLAVDQAEFESSVTHGHSFRLRFRLLNGVDLASLEIEKLRLHFRGDAHITYALYLRLLRGVAAVRVQSLTGGRPSQYYDLPEGSVRPVGFGAEHSLLPYPDHAFPGYQLLQEYFALPEKFLFIDIHGLERLVEMEGSDPAFEIVFEFERASEETINLTPRHVALHCTPAINLFAHSADPVSVDHTRTEYRIRPSCDRLEHFEVYSIDKVTGIMRGTARRVHYVPFYEFSHYQEEETAGRGYYQSRVRESGRPREEDEEIEVYRVSTLRDSPVGYGTDSYLTFVALDNSIAVPSAETISADLTCSNRHLPEKLNVGDVCEPAPDSPEFATFSNITKPTGSVNPPLDGGLHWRLISHLSLNYLSLTSVEALRGILELYNFQAYYDQRAARENEQRMEGIVAVRHEPAEWILRGSPIRGRAIHIDLNEDNFAGEGDMHLFASTLDEFFALYSTVNSFTRLTVRGVRRGEVYQWPRRLGRQIVL
jgi:type VI secretion system protein ImpG